MRVPDGEIKDIRLRHKRHFCDAHIIPETAFLQALHDTARGSEPKSAAAAKHNGMNLLGRHQGVQQLAFPGRRPASAHVQPGPHAVLAQKHRHTRARLSILRLSDADARKTGHRNFPLPGSFRHALSGCAAARQKGIHQEKQPSFHVCLPSCSLAGPSRFRHNPALNLSVPVITSSVYCVFALPHSPFSACMPDCACMKKLPDTAAPDSS